MARILISQDQEVLQEVTLTKARMTLGRHPQNDIVIDHRTVSGRHAAITTVNGEAVLEDLGSTNGTFVNGQRVVRHVLGPQDHVKLAVFHIKFIPGELVAPAADAGLAPPGVIEVRSGVNAGRKLPLSKPITTLGRPGVLVVIISRKPEGYFVHPMEGDAATLNGRPLPKAGLALSDGDTLDLSGTAMVFTATSS